MLIGTIPSSFGNLLNLVYLSSRFNNLQGVISTSLYNLSSLQKLDLQNNKFGGSLPNYYGDKFPQLWSLALNGNKFHGHIPLSLFNCLMLELIQLDNNSFSGTIPSSVGIRDCPNCALTTMKVRGKSCC
uniref:Uncharacterized protein n=1 Tax=Arundo donax TaxID=35708 RepID=A0A0A9DL37_ARUDO